MGGNCPWESWWELPLWLDPLTCPWAIVWEAGIALLLFRHAVSPLMGDPLWRAMKSATIICFLKASVKTKINILLMIIHLVKNFVNFNNYFLHLTIKD